MSKTITRNGHKGFEKAYLLVPAGEQIKLRDRIMELCGWNTIMTFHRKRKGEAPIRKPERPIIEDEFARFGINAFEGKYFKEHEIKSA